MPVLGPAEPAAAPAAPPPVPPPGVAGCDAPLVSVGRREDGLPDHWQTPPHLATDAFAYRVAPGSPEYRAVAAAYDGRGHRGGRIAAVFRAEQHWRWHPFAAAAARPAQPGLYPSQLWLWHGLPAQRLPSVLRTGLDVTQTKRAAFGRGVYFTPRPSLADQYTRPLMGVAPPGGVRVLLLCRVLMRRAKQDPGVAAELPEGFDAGCNGDLSIISKPDNADHNVEYVVVLQEGPAPAAAAWWETWDPISLGDPRWATLAPPSAPRVIMIPL